MKLLAALCILAVVALVKLRRDARRFATNDSYRETDLLPSTYEPVNGYRRAGRL